MDPKILDILKAANVKATFFVVGVNAERYPSLVRRIVNEGHEIGNHTYYHPNLALCWPEHIRLELNATQLLLETITGRATTFFRPPYAADTGPTELSELAPLKIAEDLNYLVVLENIDPQDWAKPGADIILRRIKQQRHDGSVILLHDAGGDRSQTVEALPLILDWLHTRGDTIVPLSTLLGTTRDAVMPPVQRDAQFLSRFVSSTGFRVYHSIEEFLWAFMIVATALVVIRTLIVIWLAARFRREPKTDFAEPISVVMAAYNEEKVIAQTMRTLLATDYKGEIEVVVVDDGSRDQTAAEIERIAQSVGPASGGQPLHEEKLASDMNASRRGWTPQPVETTGCLSGVKRGERRFDCYGRKITGKPAHSSEAWPPRATASSFSSMPIRNVNATPSRVSSSRLRSRGPARCPVMRRWEICARSSHVVRRWNTPVDLIWIGARTLAGNASPWCRVRSAPCAKTQLTIRADLVWKRSPKIPI